MLTAHVADFGHPPGADPERFQLVAPYESDPARWADLNWTNRHNPDATYSITTTGQPAPGLARVQNYRDVIADYRVHPEPKSLAPDGRRSGWRTSGLLQRRPVTATRTVYIGKEANEIEEAMAGLVHDEHDRLSEYHDPCRDPFAALVAPFLAQQTRTTLRQLGLSGTAIVELHRGDLQPLDRRYKRLTAAAADLARQQLQNRGIKPPRADLDALAAYHLQQS